MQQNEEKRRMKRIKLFPDERERPRKVSVKLTFSFIEHGRLRMRTRLWMKRLFWSSTLNGQKNKGNLPDSIVLMYLMSLAPLAKNLTESNLQIAVKCISYLGR